MYNMLIVDNEQIIVDGLAGYFSQLDSIELEVYSAYSGKEALLLLQQTKFDVVLTDIRMPGLSGLELQEQVKLHWPRCKVIFLTGYDEFDYAQQAIRNGASNYILKTEGYETIRDAVFKVLGELQETLSAELLLSNARKQRQASLPLLQKEFMQGLLLGDPAAYRNRRQQLSELQIDLDGEEQAFLLVGRIDEWRNVSVPSDKALITFAIQNIAEEFLRPSVRFHCSAFESSRMVWVIQPQPAPDEEREELQKRALLFVRYMLQDYQTACKQFLKITVSFAVGQAFVDWRILPEQFESLKLLLNFGLGSGVETIMLDNRIATPAFGEPEAKLPQASVTAQVRRLQSHLENGESAEFYQLLAGIFSQPQLQTPQQATVRLEYILSLGGLFLSFINRWNLHREVGSAVNLDALANWNSNISWNAYAEVFSRIAETLFRVRVNRLADQESAIVAQIEDFIKTHMSGDLSLSKIGEAFGHHPYYLSRLYKQMTNRGLAEYISEERLNKAKELLQNSDRPIHEISSAVGFISEKYFYRFFKKSLGVTPQTFRDQVK